MAGPLDKNISTASGIADILQLILGKRGGTETAGTTTSGSAESKQTMVNASDIMQQILGATGKYYGGNTLADVAAGRKRAGLYGGSSGMNEQRFLTQAATEAAVASAPTILNKSPTMSDIRTVGKGSQAGLLSGGGMGLGALALLAGSKSARKKVGDIWSDVFGDGNDLLKPVNYFSDDSFDSGAMNNVLNSAAADGASLAAASTYDAGSNLWDVGASSFDAYDAGANAFDVGASSFDGASFADAGGGIPYLSAGLNLAEGDVGGAAGSVGGALLGNMVLPGIGGAIGGFLGGQIFDDSCFITTATLHALGEDTGDTSPQLQTLRHYRDTWLHSNHPEDIQEYYRIAPAIVSAINTREDAPQVWKSLWQSYLSPALTLIAEGRNEEAYLQYREMVSVATNWSKE